ncbi:hypothetical protein KUTeg_018927 [Tegillarca granosa]|uniref:Uncharacterized protein n=1 Tax=Tegillarca granosa TaxID=220873 RepID=A0ABQ9EF96_TEGGR|nr:hypothetical protein KUTeg_018927 [Tegillarca granosa]
MDRGASGYSRSPPSSKKVTWMEPIEQGGAAVRTLFFITLKADMILAVQLATVSMSYRSNKYAAIILTFTL